MNGWTLERLVAFVASAVTIWKFLSEMISGSVGIRVPAFGAGVLVVIACLFVIFRFKTPTILRPGLAPERVPFYSPKRRRIAVCVLLVFLVLEIALIINSPSKKLREKDELSSEITTYVKSYGFVGDGKSLFVEVDTSGLLSHRDQYLLMVGALLRDLTVEPMSDERVEKSNLMEISGKRTRIEFAVSDHFVPRINSQKSPAVTFYLCLIPRQVKKEQILQLRDVFSLGGKIIGHEPLGSGDSKVPGTHADDEFDIGRDANKWGTTGDRSAFIVVDGTKLLKFQKDFNVAFACRVTDYSIDAMEDPNGEFSRHFSIVPDKIRMEFELTDKFAARLLSGGEISYYVILVPKGKETTDFSHLKQVLMTGGRVLGWKGLGTKSELGKKRAHQNPLHN